MILFGVACAVLVYIGTGAIMAAVALVDLRQLARKYPHGGNPRVRAALATWSGTAKVWVGMTATWPWMVWALFRDWRAYRRDDH